MKSYKHSAATTAIQSIAGERHADGAIADIRTGTSDPDRLLRAVTRACAEDGNTIVPGPAMTGAVRRIQKMIEQEVGDIDPPGRRANR